MKIKIIITVLIMQYFWVALALNKNEFIAGIKKTAGFNKISLQLQSTLQQKNIATAKGDWKFSVSGDILDRDKKYTNITYNTAKLKTTIAKTIITTGDNISLSYSLDNTNVNNNNYSNDKYSILYSHPLLKNNNGVSSMLAIDLAKIDAKIIKLKIIAEQQKYITNKLQLFFDWLSYKKQLEINKTQLILANKLLTIIKEKYINFLVEEVDILAQNEFIFNTKQAILATENKLANTKEQITKLINKDIANEEVIFNFDTTYTVINKNLEDSALFKQLKLIMQKTKRTLNGLKDAEQAKLNLNFKVTKPGKSFNFLTGNLNNPATEYSLGLNYEKSFGSRVENAKIIQSKISLNEQKLNYKELLNNNQATVINLKKSLKYLQQQITLIQQKLINAKEKTLQQQNRYNEAQIDISLVISAINDQKKIELEKINYQKQYHNTYYNYMQLLDLIK